MFRVFNMGVGMVLVVERSAELDLLTTLEPYGAWALGEVVEGAGGVSFGPDLKDRS